MSTKVPSVIYPYPPIPGQPSGVGTFYPTHPYAVANGPFSNHATLASGLVSYWKLDEISGDRADSVGSNTLTDNNTVTSATGMRNLAAQFTAANSESLSRASFASVGSKVSIVAWVKFASNAVNQVIIAARGSGGAWFQDNQFHLRLEGATIISALVTNTALGLVQSQKTIADPTGVWHQVVFSYDDTTDRVVHWYFDDGADTASTALTGTYQTTAATLQLGTSNDIGAFLGGSIDEVGLWSRVLTAQERTDLYNAGAGLFY